MATTKEYRGRHEIIAQMLRTAQDNGNEGVPKTLFMYKSFLSHTQLKEYLSFLVENGLLEELSMSSRNSRERTIYKITEKGLRFLHIINEIKSLTGPENIS